MFKRDIQYLATYQINGTNRGETFTIAFDFPREQIKDNANDTGFNMLTMVMEIHNNSYHVKVKTPNDIGFMSLTRIN